MLRSFASLLLLALALLALPFQSRAQALEIDIVGGNAAALPITVVPMPYLGTNVAPDTDVAAVIAANLNRSGQFRTLPDANIIEKPIRGSEIQFPTW
ncbi:MAG: Tol-Pal system protein TolB, partial [Lysobacteraceae bacterium]